MPAQIVILDNELVNDIKAIHSCIFTIFDYYVFTKQDNAVPLLSGIFRIIIQ